MKIAQVVAVHPELSKEFGYVGRWRGEWEWLMSSVFWSFVLSSFRPLQLKEWVFILLLGHGGPSQRKPLENSF